jgi:hypothetical protein
MNSLFYDCRNMRDCPESPTMHSATVVVSHVAFESRGKEPGAELVIGRARVGTPLRASRREGDSTESIPTATGRLASYATSSSSTSSPPSGSAAS